MTTKKDLIYMKMWTYGFNCAIRIIHKKFKKQGFDMDMEHILELQLEAVEKELNEMRNELIK